MKGRVLGREHWGAAVARRAMRERAAVRKAYLPKEMPRRMSLDDILGPAFDPNGGDAA